MTGPKIKKLIAFPTRPNIKVANTLLVSPTTVVFKHISSVGWAETGCDGDLRSDANSIRVLDLGLPVIPLPGEPNQWVQSGVDGELRLIARRAG